jgi:diguanylate cyclase (GGDEF)-like protein
MVIYVIYNRKKVNRHAAVIFLFFFALPIIGMLIQINNSRVYFSWTSIVLAILVTYIFLESTTGEKDYLTNLFSRQSYDRYIRELIEKKHSFAVALIDLDHFKAVNDKYGHFEGDHLLIGFSRALEDAFTNGEFIARLSGDEFMIVLAAGLSSEDINEAIYQRLFQSKDPLLKTLSFSLGYQEHKAGMSLDQLYTMADREMYKAKKHIKKPYENNGKKE